MIASGLGLPSYALTLLAARTRFWICRAVSRTQAIDVLSCPKSVPHSLGPDPFVGTPADGLYPCSLKDLGREGRGCRAILNPTSSTTTLWSMISGRTAISSSALKIRHKCKYKNMFDFVRSFGYEKCVRDIAYEKLSLSRSLALGINPHSKDA